MHDYPPSIDGFWYLATPFSKYKHGLEAAFREACRAAGWFAKQKIPCYCPIAETYPIAMEANLDPCDLNFWLAHERPKMDVAAGLIVVAMKGWRVSEGCWRESDIFREAIKPRLLMSWPVPSFDDLDAGEFDVPGMAAKTCPAQTPATSRQVGGNWYEKMAIQPADFIFHNKLDFFQGSAIEHLCRFRDKDGVKDLDKTIHFVEMLKQFEYGGSCSRS